MTATRRLPWDAAVAAGVITDEEVPRLAGCVWRDENEAWHINLTALTDAERERLDRAVRWFCGRLEVMR